MLLHADLQVTIGLTSAVLQSCPISLNSLCYREAAAWTREGVAGGGQHERQGEMGCNVQAGRNADRLGVALFLFRFPPPHPLSPCLLPSLPPLLRSPRPLLLECKSRFEDSSELMRAPSIPLSLIPNACATGAVCLTRNSRKQRLGLIVT